MLFRPISGWNGSAILALAVAATLSGCGGADTAVGPSETEVIGVWTLLSLNGSGLPVDYGGICGQNNQNLTASNVAIAGSITFYENFRYAISMTYDSRCPGGELRHNTASADGDWKLEPLQPNSVTLIPAPGNGGVVLTGVAHPVVPISAGRMAFAAQLPSVDGSAPNATPVVVTMMFGR